jgi:hypothetical protein
MLVASSGIAAVAADAVFGEDQTPQFGACLPAGIQLSDVAERRRELAADGSTAAEHAITVEAKLLELGAKCTSEKKLLDASGKEIAFYRLTGCWGYPPNNYREILQNEQSALATLRKARTVITITCNPSGSRIP